MFSSTTEVWLHLDLSPQAPGSDKPQRTRANQLLAIGPNHLNWEEHTSEMLLELFKINVIVSLHLEISTTILFLLDHSSSLPSLNLRTPVGRVHSLHQSISTKTSKRVQQEASSTSPPAPLPSLVSLCLLCPPHSYQPAQREFAVSLQTSCRLASNFPRDLSGNSGKHLGYRMSKTALNQQSVTMAKDIEKAGDKVAVVALYPGHLATRMTNYSCSNDMGESISGVVDVIESIDLTHTGTYVNWKGETLPW